MLYIFADSFSVPDAHKDEVIGRKALVTYMTLEKNWTRIVSESIIGDDNHVNDSVLGCSNEYILHTLRTRESSFKDGDRVIIQLTSYYREWFF